MTTSADPRYICMDVHATHRLASPGLRCLSHWVLSGPTAPSRAAGLSSEERQVVRQAAGRQERAGVGGVGVYGPPARDPGPHPQDKHGHRRRCSGKCMNLQVRQGFLAEPREGACPRGHFRVWAAPIGARGIRSELRSPKVLEKSAPSLSVPSCIPKLFYFLFAARLFLSLNPLQLACSVQNKKTKKQNEDRSEMERETWRKQTERRAELE